MDKKVIKTPTYVNAPGIVRMDFFSPDFSALIDNKGYDAIWERALQCPCSKREGAPMSGCINCGGTGWVFINPMQIKVVSQSLNKDTKYKEWSQERLGTVSFTVRPEYHLSFMDKITLLNTITRENENRKVFFLDNHWLVGLIYPVSKVIEIFKFIDPKKPLQKLDESDYTIEGRFIKFAEGAVQEGDSVTVSYEHNAQYHILDLNHDIRNTIILDDKSREEQLELPISAVGRRVDVVLDSKDFTGANLVDNSYL